MAVDAAIPSELTGFSAWAQQQDREVLVEASRIDEAIERFNAMPQNPRYIGPLPYLGSELASLAAQMSAVDEWVGKVGSAFEQADTQGSGVSGINTWTSMPDATLTAMVASQSAPQHTAPSPPPPTPTVQPGPSPSPQPTPKAKSGSDWKKYLEAAGWFALAGASTAVASYYLAEVVGVFVLYATIDIAAPEGAPIEIPAEAVTGTMGVLVLGAAAVATFYFGENGLHTLDPKDYPAPPPLPAP